MVFRKIPNSTLVSVLGEWEWQSKLREGNDLPKDTQPGEVSESEVDIFLQASQAKTMLVFGLPDQETNFLSG